jgi:apolipoprotein N-acyltransferase
VLRKIVLPAFAGILLVLSFPGWNIGPLAWIALVPLFLSLNGASARQDFRRGFLAFFVAFTGSLYWVYPTCRAGGVNAFASLLAVTSLSAYCALFGGAFGWAVRRFESLPEASRPFASAAAWVALEFLRSHLLTGFPWLLLAYSQWRHPALMPLGGVGGAYVVSFMLVLANGVVAQFIGGFEKRPMIQATTLPAVIVLTGLLLVGGLMFHIHRSPVSPVLKVAVVQGNIDQYKKWDHAYEDEIAETFSRLTKEAASAPVDLIIWPETSVPGWFPNDPRWTAWISGLAKEVRTPLLIGAVTRDGGDYNSAFLISADGRIAGRYRKRHLVPFGEIIPFQSLLGRWIPVLGEMGDFDASDDWTVFRSSGSAFGVNICFESLFPGLVREFVRRGAGFTVNMTNDGWFLDSAAPDQHFAAAPFRAVENRTWVVSATNTGVTALVDPSGRVAARLPRGRPGILRGEVVPDPRGAPYTRAGDVFAWLCAAAAVLSLTPRRATARIKTS